MLLLGEAGKLPLCRPLRSLAVESRIPEPVTPFPPPYLFLPLLCSKALVDLSFLPVPTLLHLRDYPLPKSSTPANLLWKHASSFLGSFWNRKILRKENGEKKVEGKKICRKIKSMFKFNKLILYVYLNSFYLCIPII